ncbi:MAG TPA: hypothetical protein VFN10_00135 [Thermoanaerobaculia bacterium]|nr:hypothetical protein [Thermoanaerobaculia bacterium]
MTYRKHGRTARWENGTLIRIEEHGVALEDADGVFTCQPEPARASQNDPWQSDDLESIAKQLAPLNIERLILAHGVAEHQCEGRTWRDETRRLHLSLTRERMRVLIDLATFDLEHVRHIAEALQRAELAEREPPARLRLAPPVTAALLPSLLGIAPPNVRIVQPAGGVDGKGLPIERADGEPWPNWYRPSYRVRPMRTALNIAAECAVTEIDEGRPRAIALLAPPDALTLHVLVEDGARVYPTSVRVARIDAVAHAGEWYPYGAGSFGAEMML